MIFTFMEEVSRVKFVFSGFSVTEKASEEATLYSRN